MIDPPVPDSPVPDSPDQVAPGYHLPRGRLARALPLVGLTLRHVGGTGISALRRDQADVAARHGRAAERYADLLGHSRGVLMKAGQLLSLAALSPAIPAEHQDVYQAALARLQDDAPPMPGGLAVDLAESEFGCPLRELFSDFDPHPIAAASIGQVHAARLQDGREVAVKIQYPGVAQAIRADLRNGELLASFLQFGSGLTSVRADLPALARELTARIADEIDYRAEAASQAAFAAAYRGHPFIRIPEIVPELCTGRVLTMELIDGLRWPRARTAGQALRDRWGDVLFRFAVGSLIRLGMLNADPHPGNYLFHADGGVTFLDFGCVRRYTAGQVATMQSAAQAVVDCDETKLHRVLAEAGYLDQTDPPRPPALMCWLREALQPIVAPQPFSYTPEFATELIRPDLSRSGRHAAVISRLAIPADLLSVARVNLGLTAVLGELRATADWDAIRREYSGAGTVG